MTGLVRKALTIAAGFAVVASVASAGVPDAAFSTIDQVAVGTNLGTLTTQSGFPLNPGYDVTVRDVTNQPLPGVIVSLNYSASGMKVYSTQNAGTTINLTSCVISRTTNGAGQVVFGPRTAKFNDANTVEVSANGVVLGNVKGRSTDIFGEAAGTTGLNDLSDFSNAFLLVPSTVHTNYDVSPDGLTGLNDLSIFSLEFLTGPALTFCP